MGVPSPPFRCPTRPSLPRAGGHPPASLLVFGSASPPHQLHQLLVACVGPAPVQEALPSLADCPCTSSPPPPMPVVSVGAPLYFLQPMLFFLILIHPSFIIHAALCILHLSLCTLYFASCILHPASLHPASCSLHPASNILHSASCMPHPTSHIHIPHLASYSPYCTSYILHHLPVFCIPHPAFCNPYAAPCILDAASFILYPALHIPHPVPCLHHPASYIPRFYILLHAFNSPYPVSLGCCQPFPKLMGMRHRRVAAWGDIGCAHAHA